MMQTSYSFLCGKGWEVKLEADAIATETRAEDTRKYACPGHRTRSGGYHFCVVASARFWPEIDGEHRAANRDLRGAEQSFYRAKYFTPNRFARAHALHK